jgi:1-acyl-sn-glycerol-3-phosphate acyltransferase
MRRMRVWLDTTMRIFVRLVLGIFFRRVELFGEERLSSTGATIWVGNHGNSLIDPALALGWLPRGIRFLAKSTLWRHPVIAPFVRLAGAVPVYRHKDRGVDTDRNRETFSRCFEILGDGGSIALFPEGVSHDEPRLQRLKTGAARIALGTLQRQPDLDLRIVPFGLHFEDRTRFRSAALIEIGSEIHPKPFLTAQAEADRQAVDQLTERIEDGLRRVTLSYDSWEEAHLIRRAATLYGREEAVDRHGMVENLEYQRAFSRAYAEIKSRHPEETTRVRRALRAYDRSLAATGLRDRQVAADYPRRLVTRFLLRHLFDLLILLPLGAVGTVINWLPYRIPGWITGVLPLSRDLRATYKLMIALFLFPAVWLLLGRAIWVRFGWQAGLGATIVAPLSGHAALLLRERWSRLVRESRAYLLLRLQLPLASTLRQQRSDLLAGIRELVELYREGDDRAAR